jgi:hypothetical protein
MITKQQYRIQQDELPKSEKSQLDQNNQTPETCKVLPVMKIPLTTYQTSFVSTFEFFAGSRSESPDSAIAFGI